MGHNVIIDRAVKLILDHHPQPEIAFDMVNVTTNQISGAFLPYSTQKRNLFTARRL